MPSSSKWSFPFEFSNQNIIYISHLSHAGYMLHPPHPPWFDHHNNIWWSVQIMNLFIMQSSPASCHLLLLGPNILLIHQ
jgi:hypothetical protein